MALVAYAFLAVQFVVGTYIAIRKPKYERPKWLSHAIFWGNTVFVCMFAVLIHEGLDSPAGMLFR